MSAQPPRDRGTLALFIAHLGAGGAEAAMVRLAGELVRRGEQVDLVVLRARGPRRDHIPQGVRLVDLGVSRAALSPAPLARYLLRTRPAVVLSNLTHLNIVTALLRWSFGNRFQALLLEHNDWRARLRHEPRPEHRMLLRLMRTLYPRADRLAAVSRGAADSLAAVVGLDPDRVAVLPNGLDLPAVARLAQAEADHPWFRDGTGDPVLVAIGRLVPQKGFAILLEALARLRRRVPARLALLGEGPLRHDLEAQAHALGLAPHVAFLGFQANPYAYLARADLFVLSSLFEGFGIVVLEALACGTPVVATDCPSGPAEILAGGRYGLLVPPSDPEALAAAMERVLTDADLARSLRTLGPERAKDYAIERVAGRFLSLIGRGEAVG